MPVSPLGLVEVGVVEESWLLSDQKGPLIRGRREEMEPTLL
jgi:hypothetical protein